MSRSPARSSLSCAPSSSIKPSSAVFLLSQLPTPISLACSTFNLRQPCFSTYSHPLLSLSHIPQLTHSVPQFCNLGYNETKRHDGRFPFNAFLRRRVFQRLQRLPSQSFKAFRLHHGLPFVRCHVHSTRSIDQETHNAPTFIRWGSLSSLLS